MPEPYTAHTQMSTPEVLKGLPRPDVVEDLSFDEIISDAAAAFGALHPDNPAKVALESDPVRQVLEVHAYREMILRSRVNNAALACTVQFAQAYDLDHLAGFYGVTRLLIQAEDTNASPPTPAIWESDDDLRRRVMLAPDGHTTAGSAESYIFHTLSADPDVRDAAAWSPSPCEARVSVLSRSAADGAPTQQLLDAVFAYLSDQYRRPLGDRLEMLAPTIKAYTVEASFFVSADVDYEIIISRARDAVEAYTTEHFRLGHDIAVSALYRALHQSGSARIEMTTPAADIFNAINEAARCTDVILTFGGYDV